MTITSSLVFCNKLIFSRLKPQVHLDDLHLRHNSSQSCQHNMNILLKRHESRYNGQRFQAATCHCISNQIQGSDSIEVEDDDTCPVECVKEFKTDDEFLMILEKAKKTNSLVVVDFYRTSCGSCKYIEQGFVKLCKGSGDHEDPVVFLKHNVVDEYDEQSEVADRLRIKSVPMFHFYKDGVLLEAFPTRDKERILAAITKYITRVQ